MIRRVGIRRQCADGNNAAGLFDLGELEAGEVDRAR
jgi:hypothetical protein